MSKTFHRPSSLVELSASDLSALTSFLRQEEGVITGTLLKKRNHALYLHGIPFGVNVLENTNLSIENDEVKVSHTLKTLFIVSVQNDGISMTHEDILKQILSTWLQRYLLGTREDDKLRALLGAKGSSIRFIKDLNSLVRYDLSLSKYANYERSLSALTGRARLGKIATRYNLITGPYNI